MYCNQVSISTMSAVWFTVEYVLRFVCSPQKLRFTINPMNLIDIAAIAPYYVTLIVNLFLNASSLGPIANIRRVLQILRVLRIFRVLKLARHSTGLQALGYTFSSSYRELGLLVLFLFIGVVSFAALIYFAEKSENGNVFSSIPAAFWYSLWITFKLTSRIKANIYAFTVQLIWVFDELMIVVHNCRWAIITMTTVGYGYVRVL